MPTVSCNRDQLFELIGQKFTDDEFDHLCFEFGVELDEITSDKIIAVKERGEQAGRGVSDDVIYKIDVPANRYDILCVEGIARALRVFIGYEGPMDYVITTPPDDKIIKITQHKETLGVRKFVVGAVLRNIEFNKARYASFIDLQDKLHQNIGRRRTLLAIGTHDLDTIKPPFSYEALPRKNISFLALSEEDEMTAEELFHHYKNVKANCHLKPYLSITDASPVHPVIYDSNRTDWTKLNIALNTMVSMFNGYCEVPFSVERVQCIGPDGKKYLTPTLQNTEFTADVAYINRGIGIDMQADDMARILARMNLPTEVKPGGKQLLVKAGPMRTDILHQCDILEDVAIAYGYNNLVRSLPKTATEGKQLPINKLSDLIREIVAQAGYTEVLTWILVNNLENFDYLNRKDNGTTCVTLANPKQVEFNVVRTSLLPGLLKTLNSNQGRVQLPIKIFELSDVCLLDAKVDVGARNQRMLGALFCGVKSGFEEIYGLVDRVMLLNGYSFGGQLMEQQPPKDTPAKTYFYRISQNPSFFPSRRADVITGDGRLLGTFGIVHPIVLNKFEITHPASAMELNVEVFL